MHFLTLVISEQGLLCFICNAFEIFENTSLFVSTGELFAEAVFYSWAFLVLDGSNYG